MASHAAETSQGSGSHCSASAFQSAAKAGLERVFPDVRTEWSISHGATDALAHDPLRYAPRVDLAVGPFSTLSGASSELRDSLLPPPFLAVVGNGIQNPNPRCLLAIELAFSGSSKHMVGDLLNASAMGMYGIVVGTSQTLAKLRRIRAYLTAVGDLGKVPRLFRNLEILSVDDFENLLADSLRHTKAQ